MRGGSLLCRVCWLSVVGGLAPAHELLLLQWNPHWECTNSEICVESSSSNLTRVLVEYNIDFANVVELAASYVPPVKWGVLGATCGRDTTQLFYNRERWREVGSATVDCMETMDRPYLVQSFEQLCCERMKLVVVAAHFSHRDWYTSLKRDIRNVMAQSGADRFMLIADTNVPNSRPNHILMDMLGVRGIGRIPSTALHKTCCLNDGYQYAFDRILVNFGEAMSTTVLFEPVPAWVPAGSAFHKALLGRLDLGALPTQAPTAPPPTMAPAGFDDPSTPEVHATTSNLRLFALVVSAWCVCSCVWFLISHARRRQQRAAMARS